MPSMSTARIRLLKMQQQPLCDLCQDCTEHAGHLQHSDVKALWKHAGVQQHDGALGTSSKLGRPIMSKMVGISCRINLEPLMCGYGQNR